MNSILKSRGSWGNALLVWGLLTLLTPLFSLEVIARTGGKSTMTWQSRHPDVAFYEGLYNKEATRIQGLMNRSAPSIRFIVTQLQRRKMPLELMFVPLIESGYNPYAESPVGAIGPWQIMPKTAQQYGIIRHDWFDGRKDLMASTRGALNYLSYLYTLFERDWMLALAAYNAGEGTVQAAIAQNKAKGIQTDFWSLSLPQETKQYVPKLLALVRLYRAGRIQLQIIPEESRLIALHVEDGVSLAWLARKLGRSKEELSYYNAGLENAVAPRGSRVALLMPAGWGERARKILGARNGEISLPEEETPLLIAARRALPDEELKSLGWGVGLVQKSPGAMERYPDRLASDTQGASEKAVANESATLPTSPHWRTRIEPLNQWNTSKTDKSAPSEKTPP